MGAAPVIAPATRQTLGGLLDLTLAPGQEDLVAPAPVTLAQQPYTPGSEVWGIWQGETAVGLIAMIDPKRYVPLKGQSPRPDAAYVWRLMVDAAHQRKGYGRAALFHACGVAEGWGYASVSLTVADVPHSNRGFYEALGFVATGTVFAASGEIEFLAPVETIRLRAKASSENR